MRFEFSTSLTQVQNFTATQTAQNGSVVFFKIKIAPQQKKKNGFGNILLIYYHAIEIST
jgi:hypothetical protein